MVDDSDGGGGGARDFDLFVDPFDCDTDNGIRMLKIFDWHSLS